MCNWSPFGRKKAKIHVGIELDLSTQFDAFCQVIWMERLRWEAWNHEGFEAMRASDGYDKAQVF